ncbi:hypothetical protein PV328_005455 [Microctonus aethiopoides]|uniref:Uncharacterized protein n=1 Tax=Microctonus aethiopoides TaxID=144406 RepID=A0AA39KSA6_9HYME|nr:hypothetical protein PV328_005455 [Microctonus aethiopoides]
MKITPRRISIVNDLEVLAKLQNFIVLLRSALSMWLKEPSISGYVVIDIYISYHDIIFAIKCHWTYLVDKSNYVDDTI